MTIRIPAFAVLFMCFLPVGLAVAEIRTWTSASGDRIEAELVETQGDSVKLKNDEGTTFVIQMNKLCREDQIYARSAQTSSQPDRKDSQPSADQASPELEALFGKSFINAKKHRTPTAELSGKKIGIYFSAHWCPPCRQFTPVLVDFYNQLQAQGKPFELVFVSSDQSEQDMLGYMKNAKMPWLAVRYGSKEADKLKKKFEVRGIPTLVIINDQGKLISAKARGEVASYGAAAFDRW